MKMAKTVNIGVSVICILVFSGKSLADGVIFTDNFKSLENWRRVNPNSPSEYKIEGNMLILGTGSAGILLKKDLPEEFIISLKAKSERSASDEEFKGHVAWIKIQLYVHPGKRGEENPDYYDICFAPEKRFVYVYKYTLPPPDKPATWREIVKLMSEKANLDTKLGQWYDIRIEVRKKDFSVYIDGEEIASVLTPDEAYCKGTIGLLGGEYGSWAYFKDISIKEIKE